MANKLVAIVFAIALLQVLSSPPCRAAFSTTRQALIKSKSAPNEFSLEQTPPPKPARSGFASVDLKLPVANDLQNGVKITSLPPVAVQDKPKTSKDYLFEWGPWVFNLLLVVVGGLQVRLLRQSREEMSLQRQEMSLQTRLSVEHDRAKLFVLFPPDKPVFSPSVDVEGRVTIEGLAVRIANYGLTDATNVQAFGNALIGDDKSNALSTLKPLSIGRVIKSKTSSETVESTDTVLLELAPRGSITVPQETEDNLRNKTAHLRMTGRITYTDTYGYSRESSFDFLWVHAVVSENRKEVDKSYWFNKQNENS